MFHVSPRVYQTAWSVVGLAFIGGWAVFGLIGGPKWLLIALLVYVPIVPAALAILVRQRGGEGDAEPDAMTEGGVARRDSHP